MEKIPTNTETELTPERYIALAERLSGYGESLPFPGLEAEQYEKLKAESEEFPGFATPIDVLIERFKNEGMKVVVEGSNAFILPAQSNDVENDSVLPYSLAITDDMDPNLKAFVTSARQFKSRR